jgi:hypothetical protein
MKKSFALRDPALNAFLYAEIGTEDKGCGVTILSVLVRLGKDPWAELPNRPIRRKTSQSMLSNKVSMRCICVSTQTGLRILPYAT